MGGMPGDPASFLLFGGNGVGPRRPEPLGSAAPLLRLPLQESPAGIATGGRERGLKMSNANTNNVNISLGHFVAKSWSDGSRTRTDSWVAADVVATVGSLLGSRGPEFYKDNSGKTRATWPGVWERWSVARGKMEVGIGGNADDPDLPIGRAAALLGVDPTELMANPEAHAPALRGWLAAQLEGELVTKVLSHEVPPAEAWPGLTWGTPRRGGEAAEEMPPWRSRRTIREGLKVLLTGGLPIGEDHRKALEEAIEASEGMDRKEAEAARAAKASRAQRDDRAAKEAETRKRVAASQAEYAAKARAKAEEGVKAAAEGATFVVTPDGTLQAEGLSHEEFVETGEAIKKALPKPEPEGLVATLSKAAAAAATPAVEAAAKVMSEAAAEVTTEGVKAATTMARDFLRGSKPKEEEKGWRRHRYNPQGGQRRGGGQSRPQPPAVQSQAPAPAPAPAPPKKVGQGFVAQMLGHMAQTMGLMEKFLAGESDEE